tara:strand:- start:244 stop:426 length:183 start_codon:yes stop_codon:yes gene_type:complete
MSLEGMFDYNFGLMQHHKWSITEIENMIPWERDVYTQKLIQYVEEEKQRQKDHEQKMKSR